MAGKDPGIQGHGYPYKINIYMQGSRRHFYAESDTDISCYNAGLENAYS